MKALDYGGGEVRKPLSHKACRAGADIKEGEQRSVHLFKLVAIINMKDRTVLVQLYPNGAGWCGL